MMEGSVFEGMPPDAQDWLTDPNLDTTASWTLSGSFSFASAAYGKADDYLENTIRKGALLQTNNLLAFSKESDGIVFGVVSFADMQRCFLSPSEEGSVMESRFAVVYVNGVPTLFVSQFLTGGRLELTRFTYNFAGERIRLCDATDASTPWQVLERTVAVERRYCNFCAAMAVKCMCSDEMRQVPMANKFARLTADNTVFQSNWEKLRNFASGLGDHFSEMYVKKYTADSFGSLVFRGNYELTMRTIHHMSGDDLERDMVVHAQHLLLKASPLSLAKPRLSALAWESPQTSEVELAQADEVELVDFAQANQVDLVELAQANEVEFAQASEVEPTQASEVELAESTKSEHSDPTTTNTYSCGDCHMVFYRSYDYVRHCNDVHLHRKPFACKYCDRRFSRKAHAAEHIAAVHEDKREKLCAECGAGFRTQSKLSRHYRTVHLRLRPFQCESCDAAFSQKSDLVRHEKAKHVHVDAAHGVLMGKTSKPFAVHA